MQMKILPVENLDDGEVEKRNFLPSCLHAFAADGEHHRAGSPHQHTALTSQVENWSQEKSGQLS